MVSTAELDENGSRTDIARSSEFRLLKFEEFRNLRLRRLGELLAGRVALSCIDQATDMELFVEEAGPNAVNSIS